MIQITICDDSAEELSRISEHTARYIASHQLKAEVTVFTHPDELLNAGDYKVLLSSCL